MKNLQHKILYRQGPDCVANTSPYLYLPRLLKQKNEFEAGLRLKLQENEHLRLESRISSQTKPFAVGPTTAKAN